MSNPPVLKIELALKGRPIRSYTFAKEVVTIGRGAEGDIVLDNMGVSRSHARIEYDRGAYYVRDEGSSNGTFVNDRRIDRHRLSPGDAISIGKFNLQVGIDAAPQDAARAARSALAESPEVADGTMVLTTDQLARVLAGSTEAPPAHHPVLGIVEGKPHPPNRAAGTRPALPWILAILGAILVGLAIGAALF